jgi:hypothetical protein
MVSGVGGSGREKQFSKGCDWPKLGGKERQNKKSLFTASLKVTK